MIHSTFLQTTKNSLSELEKREKRAMERKISEMEEELKVLLSNFSIQLILCSSFLCFSWSSFYFMIVFDVFMNFEFWFITNYFILQEFVYIFPHSYKKGPNHAIFGSQLYLNTTKIVRCF
jgi:hypothetical protein